MQSLYQTLFYNQEVNRFFTEEAFVEYMLRFESALAKAQAHLGIIPQKAAEQIADCCSIEQIDLKGLADDTGLGGNLNIPLVRQLTAAVKKKDPEAGKYVHLGATSQDVIDTAIMLQLRDALGIMNQDIDKLIEQLTGLADKHRNTVMIGRTLMQQARPVTFGYKAAMWLDGILHSRKQINALYTDNLALQLGGAVGTLHGMNGKGLQVAELMSEILGLANPPVPWHTQRGRLTSIATGLGLLTGSLGKMGTDISLLMQTEVAEVFEPQAAGKGGSSTMPHKRNPVGCVAILANAKRVPGLVATMLSAMVQDQERATGAWHAEWETIRDIVTLSAGALRRAVEITDGLEVDAVQMKKNLEKTNGLIFAENVSFSLADKIGKQEAHQLLEECCRRSLQDGIHLKKVLEGQKMINRYLNPDQLAALFDPANSIGLCDKLIERVIGRR